jgi:hypothetical protein
MPGAQAPQGAQYRSFCGSGSEAQYRSCDAATLCCVAWAQYCSFCARGSKLNTVNFMQEFHPPVWTLNSSDVVHQRSGAELTSDLTQTGTLPIAARACLTEAINGSAPTAGSDPVRSPGRTMRHKKSVQRSSRLSRPLGGNGKISTDSAAVSSRIFRASQARLDAPALGRIDPVAGSSLTALTEVIRSGDPDQFLH